MSNKVAVIIVTYNRMDLLQQCIESVLLQTFTVDYILIVDNHSSDGTQDLFSSHGTCTHNNVHYLRLPVNIGGSGGFHEGVKFLLDKGFDWLWLMDDDACPEMSALQELCNVNNDILSVYGSCALSSGDNSESICWPANIVEGERRVFYQHGDLSDIQKVESIPFLGFFVSFNLIRKVGLPVKDFFISGDDAEYCRRVQKSGSSIFLVKKSIIRHPMPERVSISIFNQPVHILNIPPWKRYYDVRNRIIIAKEYNFYKCLFFVIPATIVRWCIVLFLSRDRLMTSLAFIRGIFDGLLGRKGQRWPAGQ